MSTIIYKAVKDAVSYWWLILLAGILLVGFGIWILISPFQSYLSLSLLFALVIFATGIFEVFFSLGNMKSINGWGWTLASGLVDLLIGGYLFLYPLITMVLLPLIIGCWILYRGIIAVFHAVDMRRYGFLDWGWMLLSGILVVLLALMILGNPAFGIINIIMWTGLAFIGSGIFRIYLSLKLRDLKESI